METQYCRQCGAVMAPQTKFCRACGAAVQRSAVDAGERRPAVARPLRRGQPPTALLAVAIAASILLIVAGFLLTRDLNRPIATPTPVAATLPDEHGADGLPYPEVPRIAPAEAKARVDSGQAILVDVRSQGEYDTQHAQGARSLSLADLEARYRELPQNAEIITYCT